MKLKKHLLLVSTIVSLSVTSCDLLGSLGSLIGSDTSTNSNNTENSNVNNDSEKEETTPDSKENSNEDLVDDSKQDTKEDSKDNNPKDNNPSNPSDNNPKEENPKEDTPTDNDPKEESPKEDKPKEENPTDNTSEDEIPEEDDSEQNDPNMHTVSFYNENRLITSFKFPSYFTFSNEIAFNEYSKGTYFEPYKVDKVNGYRYAFNGWSTTKGAKQGSKLSFLPKLTANTKYYATFKMNNPVKIMYYDWSYDDNGKFIKETAYTVEELMEKNQVRAIPEQKRLVSFFPPKEEDRVGNFNYNLYLNDDQYTYIGPCNDLFDRGLADCDATNLYMSGITEIGAKGFYRAKVKNVYAENVTTIGKNCFEESEVNYISLPKIKVVPEHAFLNCGKLESISLDSVTTIGLYAFERCRMLKSIHLSSDLTTLVRDDWGFLPFIICNSLESITMDSNDKKFRIENNALISNEDDKLIVGTSGTTVIPSSVKIIGTKAFDRLAGLTEITIPSTIKYFERMVFVNLGNLKTINYEGTYNDLLFKCGGYQSNLFGQTGILRVLPYGYELTYNCSDGKHVVHD